MLHDESWKPIYLGVERSKVEVTTSVSVFRQNAILLPLLRWVFPAVVPDRTSNANDTGFSLRHVPAYVCRWVFQGVSFCTLVSAGFV